MKKFFKKLGRFTTKLVSLLVICGFISLACLPLVYAMQDDARSGADYGDCQPEAATTEATTYAEEDEGSGDSDGPTYVTITIQYCDAAGKRVTPDKVIDNHLYNTSYRLVAPGIPGYELLDAAEEFTAEIKADTLITIHYQKIVAKATLTIHYKYEDDTEAEDDYTAEVEVDTSYSVDIPKIDGYAPSVNDEQVSLNDYVLSGTMVEGGVEITVTYTKNVSPEQPDKPGDPINPVEPVVKYTITIKYQDTSGEAIADDSTEEHEAGEQTFTPPEISGYIKPASQTINVSADDSITFAYEKIAAKATLTIHYVYADGSKAADDYTEDIEVGKTYRVESPRIANYTPTLNFVTGEMGEAGLVTTVTYNQNSSDQPTEYTIAIYYKDPDGKEIASRTTEVRTAGTHTFNPPEISGYIKPASQTINVSADDSITFTYEKAPADSDSEQSSDKPSAGDSQTPTDSTNSEDSSSSDQKPSTEQPSSQGTINLPTAGASDELIRNFLVLDAEVSAGGIGLWAASGVIRKIRRR